MFTIIFIFITVFLILVCYQLLKCLVFRRWFKTINLPYLTGYVENITTPIGDRIFVCVHATGNAVGKLFILSEKLEDTGKRFQINKSPQSNIYNYWKGFSWQKNLIIETNGLKPGVYILKLELVNSDQNCFYIPIILKPTQKCQIAVIASTNTWQAYNDFAELSNYCSLAFPWPLRWIIMALKILNARITIGNRHNIPSIPLPFKRPNLAIDRDFKEALATQQTSLSHLIGAEWELLKYLEREGIQYGVFSDRDLVFDTLALEANILILNTHSEYWSEEMLGQFRSYVNNKGNVLLLSGNNAYRRIKYYHHGIIVTNFRTDQNQLASWFGAGYDAIGYKTYAGYKITNAKHWAFKNLNVSNGEIFGCSDEDAFGASGYETDKITSASEDIDLLAIGNNEEGPAYMLIKQTPGKGWIFNCGSVSFTRWLNKDKIISELLVNLINKGLGKNV